MKGVAFVKKTLVNLFAIAVVATFLLTSCARKPAASTTSKGIRSSGIVTSSGIFVSSGLSSESSGAQTSSAGKSQTKNNSGTHGSQTVVDVSKDEVVDDSFVDWNKTFSHSPSLAFDTGHPDLFENDASRAIRTKLEACEIVYKVNPVREFSLVTYFGSCKNMTDDFSFFVSKDNSTWTAVTDITVLHRFIPASGWERRTYTAYDLGSDYRYLKIVTPKTGTTGEAYNPNIGRILINRMDSSQLDAMGGYVRRDPRAIYVDADKGNDKNSGFSADSAIKTIYELGKCHVQPGDKILLKAGGSYSGQLKLVASGSDANPILVDKYGSGAKPKVVGKGDYAVDILASNVTVQNLDVSNPTGTTGITIETAGKGAAKNITVTNCDIHDVKGDTGYSHVSGGIHIVAKTGATKDAAVPSWFEGLTISNNTLTNVCRSGIFMHSFWTSRTGGSFNDYVDDTNGW